MNFRFNPESMNIIPLWVKFPTLPVGYWSIEALSKLASLIDTPEEVIHQTIDYDWRSKFCMGSIQIRHDKTNCWKNKPPQLEEEQREAVPKKKKKRTRSRREFRQEWQKRPTTQPAMDEPSEIVPVVEQLATETVPVSTPFETNSQLESASRNQWSHL
ncbi:hypothetical protein HAX54_014920 [Datura stramonium]|uniref:DUF4283 domain-containing protein n=1 Tax=Datura stramonium TaxID=4076 RepID=A0ABS8RZ15_DATST|nr:hypothetical protein [Datura stramonium]